MNTGTTPFYYHYDPLGSVVNMTNATGATQWTNTYEPYGSTRTETKNDSKAPANLMKFAGEYLDPTGLYHLRARQYDPATGRFLTTDPLPRPASAPHMSTYAYAEDQPTTLIDPSGLGAIGNTCGSIVCWWNQQAGPYAKACLSGAIEGAGVGWLTGGGLVFSAAVGCGQDLASLYVERRWGPIAGAMTNLGLKGLDAYKILKRTSFTTTRVVGAATCGGAGAVAAAASCTVTINRGDQGTLNITGTVLTVVGWNS